MNDQFTLPLPERILLAATELRAAVGKPVSDEEAPEELVASVAARWATDPPEAEKIAAYLRASARRLARRNRSRDS